MQRAVDIRRGYAPYRLALGQALLQTGEPATALIHFEDAQILNPLSHEAAFGRVRALQQLEQGEDALATQKHALALLRRHIAERACQWIVERSMRFSIFITALPGSYQKRELKIAMQLAHRFETRGDTARAYEGYMRAHKS